MNVKLNGSPQPTVEEKLATIPELKRIAEDPETNPADWIIVNRLLNKLMAQKKVYDMMEATLRKYYGSANGCQDSVKKELNRYSASLRATGGSLEGPALYFHCQWHPGAGATAAGPQALLNNWFPNACGPQESRLSAVAQLSRLMSPLKGQKAAASPAEKFMKKAQEPGSYVFTIGNDLIPEQWQEGASRSLVIDL